MVKYVGFFVYNRSSELWSPVTIGLGAEGTRKTNTSETSDDIDIR